MDSWPVLLKYVCNSDLLVFETGGWDWFTGIVNKQRKTAQIFHILQGYFWISRARRSVYNFYKIIVLKIFLNDCSMWGAEADIKMNDVFSHSI